jgi:PKHD-type hydroxylase
MIKKIKLLEPEQALELREKFLSVPFEDGDKTAGAFVKNIKNNRQITPNSNEEGKQLLTSVAKAVLSHPAIRLYAYPKQICRIMTNIHGEGEYYGAHVDNAMMGSPANGPVARADLSFTLFLTEPSSYEGGELSIDMDGQQLLAKANPGELVLYDSGLMHEVVPVRSGVRVSTVGWIQSCVSNSRDRAILSELDATIAKLNALPDVERDIKSSFHKIYNNLLRAHME